MPVGKGGEILTINTPKGFKMPTRMPQDVKTALKYFSLTWIKLYRE